MSAELPQNAPLTIYPVLDLMDGLVVHGRGGRRHEYRPIESPLCPSPEPLEVARAFRERFGLDRLYVADLDAIAAAAPATAILSALQDDGFALLVDSGTRSRDEARLLLDVGVAGVMAPLETLPGPAALREILAVVGVERLVFSLDLKDGRPLGEHGQWDGTSPVALARQALASGVGRILVLDLARVGSGDGPAQLDLLATLRQEHPDVEILSGGGVRSHEDLHRFAAVGVDGVLVATALHDGSLGERA